MYNHELESIFVHIPKTAGSTLHKTLSKSCKFEMKGHTSHFTKRNPWIGTKHYPCKHLRKKYLDNYFKFCFVRNPWDIMVSSYFWWTKQPRTGRKKILQKQIINLTFDEYIRQHSNKINEVFHDNNGQHHWFADDGGNILVDYIGRFENLQEDFNVVCDKIGIPHQELPHKNKSKHKHYTEYYDDETKEIVAEIYAKDIEYFGYEFGE